MIDSLIQGLHVLVGISISLIIITHFYLMLKIIDWFFKAKEYDDKKLIKKVFDEYKHNESKNNR